MGNERIHPCYYAQTFVEYLRNPNVSKKDPGSKKGSSRYGINAKHGGKDGVMVDFKAFGVRFEITFKEKNRRCYSDLEIITSEGKKKEYSNVPVNVEKSKDGRISGNYSEGWSNYYNKITKLARKKSEKLNSE